MSESSNNKRIAKNTLILYIRMFFIMAIALYTSRVVLNGLGVENYGVYNAVGGFIAMFGVLSNSLSAAISRFITFELGKKNLDRLRQVFSCSLAMQLLIGLIIVVLAETIGVWFLNNKMVIPEGQMYAANWVLQFSIITFVINLVSVPFNASIIANEKMGVFAYISIFDAVGKLVIALLIGNCADEYRLIFYSGLLCAFALLVCSIYGTYCRRKLEGCELRLRFDKSMAKSIFAFAGWNFLGASSSVLRTHGVNILLNLFFGPVVNAARGVATQVNTAVSHFSGSFTTALNPQITKQYAAQNAKEYTSLVSRGARFSGFLLLLIVIPILFETDTILTIWLKTVPDYAAIFVQLSIISVLLSSLSNTLITLMLATGNIRNYQILVGCCQLLIFPICYVILKIGAAPQYTLVVAIVVEIVSLFLRLIMLRKMISFNIGQYLKDVVLKFVCMAALSCIVPFVIAYNMPQGWLRLLVMLACSVPATGLFCYFLGCTKSERETIKTSITNVCKKIYANK